MCTEEAGKCLCVLHGRIIYRANTWLTRYWLYLQKCVLSCGDIERLSERRGQLDFYSPPPERPQCWKGHGQHKNWSKRSSCLSVRPLQSMQSIPSLSHSFSLCPTLSSNNLCRSHSFLTAHLFISIPVVWEAHCGRARLIWNWSIMQWAKKKKKKVFFTNHSDVHVNLSRPHHWCRANWAVMKKLHLIDMHVL